MKAIGVIVLSLVMGAQTASAQPSEEMTPLQQQVQELTRLVSGLTEKVNAQAERIHRLEQAGVPVSRAAAPATAEVLTPAQRGAIQRQAAASLSAFNPEIGFLADIVGQASESSLTDTEGNDKVSAREVELVFGHPIDPYSRFDSTVTFSDFESPSVEEAYITHWGLPGEVKARLGRIRPKIGKASALHRDSLETADEPLVVSNYLGAEGLSRSGVELSGFLPLPWSDLTHEVVAGVIEGGVGEGGTLFGSTRRRPSLYARLKNFWDMTDATNLEFGTTYLTGSKDADASFEVHAVGLDGTLVHYVTPNNKLKWQNELYLQDRSEAFSETEEGVRTEFNGGPWGMYTLLDYRLSPRFGVGGRFDYVEPVNVDPGTLARQADTAWGGYLTFYQSEFARWRLQWRHTNFATGGDDNTAFLQATVAIGVHKHQLQ